MLSLTCCCWSCCILAFLFLISLLPSFTSFLIRDNSIQILHLVKNSSRIVTVPQKSESNKPYNNNNSSSSSNNDNNNNTQSIFYLFESHSQWSPLILESEKESQNGTHIACLTRDSFVKLVNPHHYSVTALVSIKASKSFLVIETLQITKNPLSLHFSLNGDVAFTNIYFYRMSPLSLNQNSFLTSMTKMLRVSSLVEIASLIPSSYMVQFQNEISFNLASYGPCGTIVSVLSQNESNYYISTLLYNVEENSSLFSSSISCKVLSCLCLLLGLYFLFLYKDSFLHSHLFIYGALIFGVVGWSLLSQNTYLTTEWLQFSTVLFSIFGALIFFPLRTNFFIYSLLSSVSSGILLFSLLHFFLSSFFHVSTTLFWFLALFLVSSTTFLFLLNSAFHSLTSYLLGSYFIILAPDMILGTNMKYILINSYHRVFAPEFQITYLAPSIQSTDVLLICIWIAIILAKFTFQRIMNCTSRRRKTETEYENLISSEPDVSLSESRETILAGSPILIYGTNTPRSSTPRSTPYRLSQLAQKDIFKPPTP